MKKNRSRKMRSEKTEIMGETCDVKDRSDREYKDNSGRGRRIEKSEELRTRSEEESVKS